MPSKIVMDVFSVLISKIDQLEEEAIHMVDNFVDNEEEYDDMMELVQLINCCPYDNMRKMAKHGMSKAIQKSFERRCESND